MFKMTCSYCAEMYYVGEGCPCWDNLAKQALENLELKDEIKLRSNFENWHKSTYTQSFERYGDTYKNMHVRNRWQGWLAANGYKERK